MTKAQRGFLVDMRNHIYKREVPGTSGVNSSYGENDMPIVWPLE